jgi:anti-sigma regulatory factor (Ser/Thr protein kinase)
MQVAISAALRDRPREARWLCSKVSIHKRDVSGGRRWVRKRTYRAGEAVGLSDSTRAEFLLPADPFAPTLARAAVASMARSLSEAETADLSLLVSEVVTNAVRHSGMPAGRDVVVRLALPPIHVEVVDEGPGFAPAGPLDSYVGWGLRLLDRLATRWGMRSEEGRNVVWFDL